MEEKSEITGITVEDFKKIAEATMREKNLAADNEKVVED